MFVRAKVEERLRAIELRRQGWSLRAIADEVGACHSSVSVWVRDEKGDATVARSVLIRLPIVAGRFKTCGRCRKLLPLESFNRHPEKTTQHWCRDCFKRYFRERGAEHREQVKAGRARRVPRAREHVLSHLRAHPCVDCSERDPVVLEFDHVRGEKLHHVARLVADGADVKKLNAEIEKCDVVCANCHRRRTARRTDSTRLRLTERRSHDRMRPLRLRNVLYVHKVLTTSPCVECGATDPVILEFDHVGPKSFAVSIGVSREYSIERLASEIAQCEVCCANCHRRRTAARAGHFRHLAGCSDAPPRT